MNVPAIGVIVLLSVAAAQPPDQGDGARALFYSPLTGKIIDASGAAPAAPPLTLVKPASPATPASPASSPASAASAPPAKTAVKTGPIGVRYWLDLDGTGPVVDTRPFKTGDRVRLHVRSNADGYLAVWSFDANGRPHVLLPRNGTPEGTFVRAGVDYISPPMSFRPPAQDEQLFLAFARQKSDVPSFEVVKQTAADLAPESGSRELAIETDDRTADQVGTYVINRRGGPIAKEIHLRHVAHVP